MNKKLVFGILIGTILICLVILTIIFFNVKKDEEKNELKQPIPTSAENEHQKEGEEMEEQRNHFIEQMHLAAPGINWRKMDADLRFTKMQERAAYTAAHSRSDDYDTLANGNLIGNWHELGSFNTAGRMRATEIDFATNTVYAFSQGGNLWKGDLNGDNWSVINDNFNIQSALFLKKLGSRLMVATDGWGAQNFYFSENEGLTWTATTGLDNVVTWGFIADVVMLDDAAHTIYLLSTEWDYTNWYALTKLYRSTDLGASFSNISTYDEPTYGAAYHFALCAAENDTVGWMLENNNLSKLLPDGTVQFVTTLPYDTSASPLLCGYYDGTTHLYAGFDETDGTQFYASDDNGVTWDEKGFVDQRYFSKKSLGCLKTSAGKLFFGGVNAYRSYNSGTTWTEINDWADYYGDMANKLHADIPFINSYVDDEGSETLLISTDGGLFKSVNGGISFDNITLEGMRNAQYYDCYTYRDFPDYLFAGAQDQGIQRSTEHSGTNYYFDQIWSGDYGHLVSNDNGLHLWMNYPGFVMVMLDPAVTAEIHTWDFAFTGNLWLPPVMPDPYDENVAWLAGGTVTTGSHLFKVTWDGSDLNAVEQPYDFSPDLGLVSPISALAFSPVNKSIRYVATDDGDFFWSTDDGASWHKTESFTGPTSHYFYGSSIVASTVNENEVYFGGSGYSNPAVYFSNDHGQTFYPLNNYLPNTLVYDMDLSPGDSILFAATETGPYAYVKEENKWYDIASDIAPYQTYWSVEFVNELNAVRFSTYGRGIWEFKLKGEPLAVQTHENSGVKIYPNPVDNTLNLSINDFLPDADISVYSIDGKLCFQKSHAALNINIPYSLSVSQLVAGNYFIVVQQDKKRYAGRFVKN